jgi:hypothetical protein
MIAYGSTPLRPFLFVFPFDDLPNLKTLGIIRPSKMYNAETSTSNIRNYLTFIKVLILSQAPDEAVEMNGLPRFLIGDSLA